MGNLLAGTRLLTLGLHNVCALLANVPLSLLAALHVLNLENGNVVVLGVLLPVVCVSMCRYERKRDKEGRGDVPPKKMQHFRFRGEKEICAELCANDY